MLTFPNTPPTLLLEEAFPESTTLSKLKHKTALNRQILELDSTLNVELQRFSGCAGVKELSGGEGFLSGASSWRAFAAAFLLCTLWAPESPAPPMLWK